jgi:hypothetical protein
MRSIDFLTGMGRWRWKIVWPSSGGLGDGKAAFKAFFKAAAFKARIGLGAGDENR